MSFSVKGDHLTRDDLDGLFNEYYPRLFNYVYYRTLNRAVADDVTSTAMLNIVRAFDTFDARKGNLDGWVYRIARNALYSYMRQSRETTDIDVVPESLVSYTDDGFDLDDRGQLVRGLLEVLSDEERELVYLKYWEELSNKEIGERLGLNASTVSTKLWRATNKMRNAMPDGEGF
jgi:RNA polymerase sigma-70 factor (ECF subfamily)